MEKRRGDVSADQARDAGGCGGGEMACDVAGSGAEVEDERERPRYVLGVVSAGRARRRGGGVLGASRQDVRRLRL